MTMTLRAALPIYFVKMFFIKACVDTPNGVGFPPGMI